MLEDYPANPMDSMQNDSPDFEEQLFDWQGVKNRDQAFRARTRESR